MQNGASGACPSEYYQILPQVERRFREGATLGQHSSLLVKKGTDGGSSTDARCGEFGQL
jgi:hypothetical protein